MLPLQGEGHFIVVEIFSESFYPIMAGHTIKSKELIVFSHKGRVHLLMAVLADNLLKIPVGANVTITADHFPVPINLPVSGQRKTDQFMREIPGFHVR